jgi:hypothetical protein
MDEAVCLKLTEISSSARAVPANVTRDAPILFPFLVSQGVTCGGLKMTCKCTKYGQNGGGTALTQWGGMANNTLFRHNRGGIGVLKHG